MHSKIRAFGIRGLLLLSLGVWPVSDSARAQTRDLMYISGVTPFVQNDTLRVSFRISNMFSQKVRGTIQSGLPSVVEYQIDLYEHKRRLLRLHQIQRILYDVWEERYTLESADADTGRVFATFQTLARHCSQIENLVLLSRLRLRPQTRYRLTISASVSPISAHQNRKLSGWLQSANQTEDDITSPESSSGFKLNLSKLVSFFMRSSNRRGNYSAQFSTEFRLSDLLPATR